MFIAPAVAKGELYLKLSIVTTLYNSEPHLLEFFERARKAASTLTDEMEFVFVNDGSPDGSLQVATGLLESDCAVKIVDLSRNFGHHKAMMTGLEHASGDLVFLIDSDLEESPEVLTEFSSIMDDDPTIDVVYGYQRQRQRSILRRVLGDAFYVVFNCLSETKIHRNLCVARLMKRHYLDRLLLHKEREVMISGLWANTGFNQLGVPIDKAYKKESSYNLRRHSRLLMNAVVSFSSFPLLLIFWMGCVVLLVSFGMISWLVFSWLIRGNTVIGWTSLVTSIWFIGGLLLFSLGTVGAYISVLFNEVKARPMTIIRQVLDNTSQNSN